MSTRKAKAAQLDPFGGDPGMSIVNEEIQKDFFDSVTEWEAKLDAMDEDAMSETCNMNFDVIENAREDSPYYSDCVRALEHYKQRMGKEGDELDVEEAAKSKSMLAIDIIIYINNQRRLGILVITQGILILIYKGSK